MNILDGRDLLIDRHLLDQRASERGFAGSALAGDHDAAFHADGASKKNSRTFPAASGRATEARSARAARNRCSRPLSGFRLRRPTGQKGLWFTGGGLGQCRIYSKYLGLRIKRQLAITMEETRKYPS
ncbi:hypothetical protein IQ288_20740 [Burkholderia sp. R-69980]|nr:hypothetical protein [Burkholderia sp. R-69980]